MITSILSNSNYNIACGQVLKYSKCRTWRSIYNELRDIDIIIIIIINIIIIIIIDLFQFGL